MRSVIVTANFTLLGVGGGEPSLSVIVIVKVVESARRVTRPVVVVVPVFCPVLSCFACQQGKLKQRRSSDLSKSLLTSTSRKSRNTFTRFINIIHSLSISLLSRLVYLLLFDKGEEQIHRMNAIAHDGNYWGWDQHQLFSTVVDRQYHLNPEFQTKPNNK